MARGWTRYGEDVALALKAAASIGIDWIAVDIDWARVWPDRNSDPDLDALDFVMQKASRYELGMLVSITNPPRWAVTAKGPDQAATIRLVLLLAQRYPQNHLSIELFPAANTAQGWGAAPDPGAYNNLLKACWSALQSSGSPVLLVAGGLEPLTSKPSNGDMDDLVFLSKLYRSGAGRLYARRQPAPACGDSRPSSRPRRWIGAGLASLRSNPQSDERNTTTARA